MSRLANFRTPHELDVATRNTASSLGVGYSAFIRASIRFAIGKLDAGEVEMLNDPELRGARLRSETKRLLED